MLERYTCMIPVQMRSKRLRDELAVDCLSRALKLCQTGQAVDDFNLRYEGNQAIWEIHPAQTKAA